MRAIATDSFSDSTLFALSRMWSAAAYMCSDRHSR